MNDFSFDVKLTKCVLNDLNEEKTKVIAKLLGFSNIRCLSRNGRLDIVSRDDNKIYSVSLIDLIDSIKTYHLKNKINPSVYKFLKSLKVELQTRSEEESIFSEIFDEFSGVNKTRNYEQKEFLKNELAKRLGLTDSEINILASLWGRGNFYELERDLRGKVVLDMEKFLINAGLSKNLVNILIEYQFFSRRMEPLKIWLIVQLLFLWNPQISPNDMHCFVSLINSIVGLDNERLGQLINYILKNKKITQNNTENNLEGVIRFLKLQIPWNILQNLSFEEIEKFVTLKVNDYNNNYTENNLYLGYSLINTEHIDYKEVFKKSSSWQEFFFLCSTSSDEDTFVKENSEFETSEEIAKHYLINKNRWAENLYRTDQINYGNRLHAGVLVGTAALKEGRWNFTQLLNFLGYQRYKIAEESKSKIATQFGIFHCINEHLTTSCERKSAYEELGKRLLEHLNTWKEDEYYNPSKRQIEIELQEEKIELSRFNESGPIVEHPFFYETLKVLNYVEELYKECLQENDREKLLKKLGQIFWLVCQAKPWLRGDPSIAEMLIKTVWLHKTGELLPPWKKGLIPWESTIEKTHFIAYGEEFPGLFETCPLKN